MAAMLPHCARYLYLSLFAWVLLSLEEVCRADL